jgi:hypothetical protein
VNPPLLNRKLEIPVARAVFRSVWGVSRHRCARRRNWRLGLRNDGRLKFHRGQDLFQLVKETTRIYVIYVGQSDFHPFLSGGVQVVTELIWERMK